MRKLQAGQPPGEAHPSSKLTEIEVRAIRRRAVAGEPQKKLAALFDVSPSTISKIANGKSWTHLGPVGDLPKAKGSQRPTARLTESDIRPICQAIQRGLKVRALARHYKVSPSTISKIWQGTTWRHVERPDVDARPPEPENPELGGASTRKRVWEH